MASAKNEKQPPESPRLVSFHGFSFPFEWCSISAKTEGFSAGLNQLEAMARNMTPANGWDEVAQKEQPLSITEYNEQNYFYDFARPALYNGYSGAILRCYRHKLTPDAQFQITTGDKTYTLRVARIEVKLYAIGIGILSLHLLNESPEQADKDQIIEINQYGRRLYPPFYGVEHPDPGSDDYYNSADWNKGLDKHPELPAKLALTGLGKEGWNTVFEAERKEARLSQVPGLIRHLLPEGLLKLVRITPVLDDRMFVVCWYGNTELSKQCTMPAESEKVSPYLQDEWWYRYLFVDGDFLTCQDEGMREQLLRAHTYSRWSNLGMITGIARYSWVTLSKVGVPPYVVAHIRTIYFRIVELALLQRACVLRFSEEITVISALKKGDRHLPDRMENLFREYLRFANKLNFQEVTAQEQGIEMYDLLRRSMRLDEQIKDLDVQIHELHNYAASLGEAVRNEKLDILTLLAALLGVPTFISTIYESMDYKIMEHPWWPILWVYVFSVLFAFGSAKVPNRLWRTVCIMLLLATLAVGFLAPIWNH